MNDEYNDQFRFGSAAFADEHEMARAGMFKQTSGSLLVGMIGRRPIYYSGAGGLLMVAGARGGKLATILGYNVCSGIYHNSLVVLDPKGELAAISQDQTPDDKFCYYWNPSGLHGLPKHRINPVDYIYIGSPSLVSDVKVFCQNMVVSTGTTNSDYFEGRAREFLEAIVLTVTKIDGVLTLPRLYHFINLIVSGGEKWLDFGFEMSEAGFPIAVRIEEEIAAARSNPSGGFHGILGEIFKAFACLSDPALMASVSPPYTFSMSDLTNTFQACQVYFMPPAEFIHAWAPIIKALFVSGMIYKSRAPSAPRQTWILDECAQLGGFPLVPQLFTYGAGIGIRPWAIYQSSDQIDMTTPRGKTIIPSSASLRSYFAVRDYPSAQMVSNMLGTQTLEYDHEAQQARARHAKQQALQALMNGGDPFSAGLDYAHHKREAERRTKQQRLLRTPAEVLGMPSDRQFIFCDAVRHPIYAGRQPYYKQAFMAGRYHPNPYHPPLDRVRVKGAFGMKWKRVIREPVPDKFAHYPQYQDGYWSKIER